MRHKQPIPTTDYDGPFQNLNSYHHNNNFINPAATSQIAPASLLANQGIMGSSLAGGGPIIVNPIDRLYSMQNMYFEKMADEQI